MGHQIHITRATIHGLNAEPEYIKEKNFYSWSLTFTNTTASFFNLAHIYLDKKQQHAEHTKSEFKARFTKANIFEGSRVAVIIDDSGNILAIANNNSPHWIDVNDKFKPKLFKDLNLSIDSLIYHA